MISIDLKKRRVISIRHYSTYGDELPFYRHRHYEEPDFIDSIKQTIDSKADADGLAVLKAVLAEYDWIFQIPVAQISGPPGFMNREPASGWEYDW